MHAQAIACASLAAARSASDATVRTNLGIAASAARAACLKVTKEGAGTREALEAADVVTKAAKAAKERAEASVLDSVVDIPKWSLAGWFTQLDLSGVVRDALLKRLVARLEAEGKGGKGVVDSNEYEWRFITGLANGLASSDFDASVQTVELLLKESPVLRQLAVKIATAADKLSEQMRDAEAESTAGADASPSFAGVASGAPVEDESDDVPSAEELNETARASGALTLSYSQDTSLYWHGVDPGPWTLDLGHWTLDPGPTAHTVPAVPSTVYVCALLTVARSVVYRCGLAARPRQVV